MMYEPFGAGRRLGVAREKLSVDRWMEIRNVSEALRPSRRACWRYHVGISFACSAILGMGRGRSHWMKTAVLHQAAQA